MAIAGYRSVRRRSVALGAILALGILARLIVGLTLFGISYLELPVAASLQVGGGFWLLAVDATRYHADAVAAIQQGIFNTNYDNLPSPFFMRVLTIWLLLVGSSPVAGVLLNVCAYVATCVLIVRMYGPVNDWRQDLPCIVAIGAYSFWPAIFVHATQPLKDSVFFALIAIVCLALLTLLRALIYGSRAAGGLALIIIALAVVMAGSFGLSGIRWYFPIIICGALVCVFALFLLRGRLTPLPFYLAGSASLVLAVWLAAAGDSNSASGFLFASGDRSSVGMVRSIGDVPAALVEMMRLARTGFVASGGNTNTARPLHDGMGPGAKGRRPQTPATVTPGRGISSDDAGNGSPLSDVQLAAVRATPHTWREHLQTVGRGLVIIFVPISLLKAISVVEFSGVAASCLLPISTRSSRTSRFWRWSHGSGAGGAPSALGCPSCCFA